MILADLPALVNADDDDLFLAEPLDPSQTDWTYFGQDAADREWAAEHLNDDDDGRDFDSEADDARAVDLMSSGLALL